MIRFFYALFLITIMITGCVSAQPDSVTTNMVSEIHVSKAEGSGALRTLTISYGIDEHDYQLQVNDVVKVDAPWFDSEAQDYYVDMSLVNKNEVLRLTIFYEYSFPDLSVHHIFTPQWPVVYEINSNNALEVVSSQYSNIYEEFIMNTTNALEKYDFKQSNTDSSIFHCSISDNDDIDENAVRANARLIFAAQGIVSGDFVPKSLYNDNSCEDVDYYTDEVVIE